MSNHPPNTPPGGAHNGGKGSDHTSRLVSREPTSVADALPTADEGDALFDELFGNVFAEDEELGDASAIATAGIAEPLDDLDEPLAGVADLDEPLDEPLRARDHTALGMGPVADEDEDVITNRPPADTGFDDDLDEPIPYAEPYVMPDVGSGEAIVLDDEIELVDQTAPGPPLAPLGRRPGPPGPDEEEETVMMDRSNLVDFASAVRPAEPEPPSAMDRVAEQVAYESQQPPEELPAPAPEMRDEIDTIDLSEPSPEPPPPPLQHSRGLPARPRVPPPAAPPFPTAPPFPATAAAIGVDAIEEIEEAELTPLAVEVDEESGAVDVSTFEANDAVLDFDEDAAVTDHAVVALMQAGERDAWVERARWLYEEAPKDPQRRADALLVVSEMLAMAGEEERAETVAREALGLAPSSPLAHRQLRGVLASRARWFEVGDALEAEARVAPNATAKLHSLYLASELARLKQGDAATAERRLEQAERAEPDDARPQIGRVMRELAAGDVVGELSLHGAPAEMLEAPLRALRALRSEGGEGEAGDSALSRVLGARAALRRKAIDAACAALAGLEGTELGPGAAWLIAVLAAPHAALRSDAVRALSRVSDGSHGAMALRAMAARALEAGEWSSALKVAAQADEGVLSAAERLTVAALSASGGPAPASLAEAAAAAAHADDLAPLAAASTAVLGLGTVELGGATARAAAQLGRALAARVAGKAPAMATRASSVAPGAPPSRSPRPPRATEDDTETPLAVEPIEGDAIEADEVVVAGDDALPQAARAVLEADPTHGVARALLLEDAYASRQVARVARALLESAEQAGAFERERALASALLAELAGDREQMMSDLDRVINAAPDDEAALRMRIADAEPELAATSLIRFAQAVGDPVRAALAFTEGGLRLMEVEGEETEGETLLRRAAETQPDIPIAPFIGMYVTQAMGDRDGEIYWLEQRRSLAAEPADAVADQIRQALRLGDEEVEARAALLEQAHRARPDDDALRELYERYAGAADDRAAWLMERVASGEGKVASLALEAALAHELGGDLEQAAASAARAVELGDRALAPVFCQRYAVLGHGADAVVAQLSERLQQAEGAERRDLHALLAAIEEQGRGNGQSAAKHLRAIVADDPEDLLALHQLESIHVRESLREGHDKLALEIARVLEGPEGLAHAMLAARLAHAAGNEEVAVEAANIAYQRDPSSSWALRQVIGHARARGDHAAIAAASIELAESAVTSLDKATLLLRAAEARLATGDDESAAELLGAVMDEWPRHPVALRERAALIERAGNAADAAEAYEELGMVSQAPRERAAHLYKAATLWLSHDDQVGNAEGRRLLEAVVEADPSYADSFERLQAIYLAAGAKRELAALLSARVEAVTDPEERIALEVMRGKMLVEAGSAAEARFALSAALEASPDNPEALSAYADVCAAERDWEAVEQSLIRLGRLVSDPEKQASIYMRLGKLYDQHLPNAERAEQAYQQVLKLQPDNLPARQKLVDLALKAGHIEQAQAALSELLDEVKSPEEKCELTVKLAEIHEAAGDLKQAEQTLVRARRAWPRDAAPMMALYEFYRRTGQSKNADQLLDRAVAEVRRGVGAGRIEPPLFAMAVAVAEAQGKSDAAEVARATLAAIEGESAFVEGADLAAGQPELDDHIAPEIFTKAFRSLLQATGAIMDSAAPFDMASLRAKPFTPNHEAVAERTREIAAAYGLPDVQVFATNALGHVCVPARVDPPTVCFGVPLVSSSNARARDFLIHRAMKIIQTHTAALARTAPIDLWPLLAAYLKIHSPSFHPPGADAGKVDELYAAMKQVAPAHIDPQVNLLASEVIGSIGNRASSVGTAANSWGSRAALLALGDPNLALEAVALAHGATSGPPASGPERVRWIGRQAEARDLIAFSVSEGYAEARAQLGLEVIESVEAIPLEDDE